MKYKGAIEWLYSFEKFGVKLGLERIIHICKELKNPQNNYKVIHVGGTNGKGSVCKYLQSILTLSGYKVGVFTSPHLQRFSERIIVDSNEISEKDIILLIEKVKPIINEMKKNDNTPTFFEIVTAMAFQYFNYKNVDFAIIEVGLGGRFDATNIVNPIITVITNISLDHQDRLGDKIEDIAYEKAGIIKNDIPVITGTSDKTLNVIQNVANKKNSAITVINDNSWRRIQGGPGWQELLINGLLKDYNVKVSMGGKFHGENISVTIATIEILQINGIYITDECIIEGIERTTIPGRFEIVGFEPLIFLDGAHNIAGITSLKNSLEEDFVYKRLILIFGILSDKKVQEILDIITSIADIIILTKSHNKRAYSPSILKKMIIKKDVFIKDNIPDAIDYAKKIAKKQDLICITGSLYTVGESREYLVL